MDSAVQRRSMVDSQVRPSDVTDRRIHRAMLAVPREAFVPAGRSAVAYMDGDLPLTDPTVRPHRSLLAPRTLAKMLQALALGEEASVLDVGPATGYSTALLAHMARRVTAVENDIVLAERARGTLGALGMANAEVLTAALPEGAETRGPFDGILIGGRIETTPERLLDQLKDGGRLVAIVDEDGIGKVVVWQRYAMSYDWRVLFDAEAGLLPGFERARGFVF
jgi:protein-L-isoaspartate(D-aspartate) O-methyltransferase